MSLTSEQKKTATDTLDILITFIEMQNQRLDRKIMSKGKADKTQLFTDLKDKLITLKQKLLRDENVPAYEQDIKEAIHETALIAHHRRYSKTNNIATGLGYVISAGYWKPAAKSESWVDWEKLAQNKFSNAQVTPEEDSALKQGFLAEYQRTLENNNRFIKKDDQFIASYNTLRSVKLGK